jgi:hypothetical protein
LISVFMVSAPLDTFRPCQKWVQHQPLDTRRELATVGSQLRRRRVPLSIEPHIEIPPPEAPLPSDPNRRQLARSDQPVDRPRVDFQIGQDLFSRQETVFV